MNQTVPSLYPLPGHSLATSATVGFVFADPFVCIEVAQELAEPSADGICPSPAEVGERIRDLVVFYRQAAERERFQPALERLAPIGDLDDVDWTFIAWAVVSVANGLMAEEDLRLENAPGVWKRLVEEGLARAVQLVADAS